MKIHDEVSSLREEIAKAFPAQELAEGVSIVNCERGYCSECKQIVDFYSGKNWRALRTEDILGSVRLAQSVISLTDDAFRCYLPAIMVAALDVKDHQDRMSSEAGEVGSALGFCFSDRAESGRWVKRMAGFTKGQREVISKFLSYLKRELEEGDFHQALKFFGEAKPSAG